MRKLLLLLLLLSFKSFGQTLETDRQALIAMYNGFSGADYPELANWVVPGNTGDSPCGWYGVTCDAGRVTKLELKYIVLGGEIAPEAGNLTALTTLDLSGTGMWMSVMEGAIPAELANLTNLEYLYLGEHIFDIASVGVIGSLTKLKGLTLTPTGDIPASFVNLVNLETLYLGSENPMGGPANFSFPSHLSTLPKLKELYLQGWVKGDFPAVIGNFSNLEVLELDTNGFPNTLPTEIGNLSKLKRLYISRYGGPGTISFVGNLSNLEELELHDVFFSGTLPANIANLTKLRTVIIGSAHLGGTIPAGISSLPNLTLLNLQYNSFTGPIPDLSNIPVAGHVNIANNAFNFEGMESNISRLDLYGNQALIEADLISPMCVGCIPTQIKPRAGGTNANNTHKLYKGNVLIRTVSGVDMVDLDGEGIYRVETTNSLVPGLTLVTRNYAVVKLPVTLVSFEGKHENNQTKLTWKTAEEINNKGFEIERSADARTFEKIGFVDGSGDTKENQFYHFTDLNPLATGYYRLKQLDYDGKFEYSKIIMLKRSNAAFKIYPNPASHEVIVSGFEGAQDFQVVDEAGRTVVKTQADAGKPVSVRSLKPGLYTIRIGTEAGRLLISK